MALNVGTTPPKDAWTFAQLLWTVGKRKPRGRRWFALMIVPGHGISVRPDDLILRGMERIHVQANRRGGGYTVWAIEKGYKD